MRTASFILLTFLIVMALIPAKSVPCQDPFAHLSDGLGVVKEVRPNVRLARYEYIVRAVYSPAVAVSGKGERILVTDELATQADVQYGDGHVWGMVEGGNYPFANLITPHEAPVSAACFFPRDPNRLVTASIDGQLKIWDISQGGEAVVNCSIDLLKRRSGQRTSSRRRRGDQEGPIKSSNRHLYRPQVGRSIQISDSGLRLATNVGDSVLIYDARSGRRLGIVRINPEAGERVLRNDLRDHGDDSFDDVGPRSRLTAFALSRDSNSLVTASYTYPLRLAPHVPSQVLLRLYDLSRMQSRGGKSTGNPGRYIASKLIYETRLFEDKGPVEKIALSPNGVVFVTARNQSGFGYLDRFAMRDGNPTVRRNIHEAREQNIGPIEDIFFNRRDPSSLWIVPKRSGLVKQMGSEMQAIVPFSTGEVRSKILHAGSTVDGKYVWTISIDHMFRVYDANTGGLAYESGPPPIAHPRDNI